MRRSEKDYYGLFGCVTGGMVKNLTVSGSVEGSKYVGGIAAVLRGGTVENCRNDCSVSAPNTVERIGGIVGLLETDSNTNASAVIKNCLNVGNVVMWSMQGMPSTIGAVTGGSSGGNNQVINSYYLNTTSRRGAGGMGGSGALSKTADELKIGSVAHLLQSGGANPIWGQTIGTDDYPVPSGDINKQVYEVKFNVGGSETKFAPQYVNYDGTTHRCSQSGQRLRASRTMNSPLRLR